MFNFCLINIEVTIIKQLIIVMVRFLRLMVPTFINFNQNRHATVSPSVQKRIW